MLEQNLGIRSLNAHGRNDKRGVFSALNNFNS